MNRLKGEVHSIAHHKELSLVKVQLSSDLISSIIIDGPTEGSYLQVGHPIYVLFKETEVILALPYAKGISLQNQLLCQVRAIDKGQLRCRVELIHPDGKIASIITSKAVEQLGLKPQMQVKAMIKTNEIMLSE